MEVNVNASRQVATVIEGPWEVRGRELGQPQPPDPAHREGNWISREVPCELWALDFDSNGECAAYLIERKVDRPPIQVNMPFADMPTLGDIVRQPGRRPWPPLPAAADGMSIWEARWTYYPEWFASLFIDPSALLQDPSWYADVRACLAPRLLT